MELAEDWLAAKAVGARAGDPGHSDAARRDDLARLGRAVALVRGRPVDGPDEATYDLRRDLGAVDVDDLSTETLLRALAVLRTTYAPTTVQRTVSTLRGFCRWLVRRGHLPSDPAADELLTVRDHRGRADGSPLPFHAFTSSEVEAMIDAAAAPPPSARSAWARRDVAVLATLAGCGLRAAELCALQVRDVDRGVERPILRVVRGTKGGRRRDVPLPRRVVERIDGYLDERRRRAEAAPALAVSDERHLFVRNDGRPLNQQFLDRLIRRCARQAGVAMPGDAAAHAFRHHFGVQLALRGVPLPVISELMGHADPRTTAIYTRAVGRHLVEALDDAGWL